MHTRDLVRLAAGAVVTQPVRSLLTALGIAVGIAAVVLLTSIGKGVQRYVLTEFTQFGTHLIGVTPGRTFTEGIPGAAVATARPLTLDDVEALRRLHSVQASVPVVQGNAEVEGGGRQRQVMVIGTGADAPRVWGFGPRTGRFLPPDESFSARALAVLGHKAKRELFGSDSALGRRVRVAGERYRVIGVMEPKGQILGFDLDDAVYLPAAKALTLFNLEGLMEIDVLYEEDATSDRVVAEIKRVLTARHGQEDFTVVTQQQMLDVLGSVLGVLTFAVGALGGISLVVGGIGVLTIMTIAVGERTGEIGLLRALGAERSQVLALFLGEAILLGAAGGAAGLLLGVGGAQVIAVAAPALPVHTPWSYVAAALLLASGIGVVAGIMPARYAAGLEPLEALRAE